MDRNFHSDEFEQLLREKSDEFRMYPSKRIWHSIYNNIHPARKWPSVAMTISLISSLFLIGYLNTKTTNLYSLDEQAKAIISQPITSFASHKIIIDGHTTLTDNLDAQRPSPGSSTISQKPPDASTNKRENNPSSRLATINTSQTGAMQDKILTNPQDDISFLPGIGIKEKGIDKKFFLEGTTTYSQRVAIEDKSTSINNSLADIKLLPYSQSNGINEMNQEVIINIPTLPQPIQNDNSVVVEVSENIAKKNTVTDKTKLLLSLEDRSWIENYALYNRPAAKKWANKLAVQMYATPSVVYRILLNEPATATPQNTTTPLVISSANQDINAEVIQAPSYGFEIGTGLQYFLVKGVKLKGGLQLNYTRYNSHGFQNTHPVVTKLSMHDLKMNSLYEVYRATPYSNKSGLEAVRLHNETFQVSLPIGADFKLLGNENLQWNFGITIQPTYVIGGKSYLISSDRRNYVKESSMLNKWNMNAGFETFITYQMNGLTWQIGPQFRSQLFSTNSRKYAVEEKLLNFGLKFGVTKTLK